MRSQSKSISERLAHMTDILSGDMSTSLVWLVDPTWSKCQLILQGPRGLLVARLRLAGCLCQPDSEAREETLQQRQGEESDKNTEEIIRSSIIFIVIEKTFELPLAYLVEHVPDTYNTLYYISSY